MNVCLRHFAHARRLMPAASVIASGPVLATSVSAALLAAILSCGSGASPTNVAPMLSCGSGDFPPPVAQGLLLTAILGDGAQGYPLTSAVPYAPGAVVPYCYAPSSGNAASIAVLDCSPVPPSGCISLTADSVRHAAGHSATRSPFER